MLLLLGVGLAGEVVAKADVKVVLHRVEKQRHAELWGAQKLVTHVALGKRGDESRAVCVEEAISADFAKVRNPIRRTTPYKTMGRKHDEGPLEENGDAINILFLILSATALLPDSRAH